MCLELKGSFVKKIFRQKLVIILSWDCSLLVYFFVFATDKTLEHLIFFKQMPKPA